MAPRPKTHDIVECALDSYNKMGVACGQLDQWRIEVTGGFVGEQVRGRISHVAKQSKRLFIERPEAVNPHPERRQAPCPKQDRCGGCSWMQLNETAQHQHKQTLLRDTFGVEADQLVQQAGGSREYRWSSKRVVGGVAGRLRFGSYRRGTHELADMRGCLVDHPDITACLEELLEEANRSGITPYDEVKQTGELRYLWLKTNGKGAVLLTLVCAVASEAAEELAKALQMPAGVYHSIQDSVGNALRGRELRHVCGATQLPITLCGVDANMGPLGFLQPNPLMAERCYMHLVKDLKGAAAYDLYAGSGITGALLARQFDKVIACDTVVEGDAAIEVVEASAEVFLERALAGEFPAPDAVVCNPPRAGLSDRVCAQLKQLCEKNPFELRIMSCDPASFARDRERLASHFELVATRAFDTLPQTPHLELVGHYVARAKPTEA